MTEYIPTFSLDDHVLNVKDNLAYTITGVFVFKQNGKIKTRYQLNNIIELFDEEILTKLNIKE